MSDTHNFALTITASGGGGTPSWAQGAVNAWVTLPGDTRLLPVMYPNLPCGSSSYAGFYSYAAGALDPNTLIYYAVGGGHNDGASNAIYAFPLSQQNPQWTAVCAQTPVNPAAAVPSAQSAMYPNGMALPGYPYFWDGRPSARHTWQNCAQVIASYGSQGQVLLMGASAVWGSGNESYRNIDTFDIANGEYTYIKPPATDPLALNPNFTAYDASGVYDAAVKDSRGALWVTASSQGAQYTAVKWSPGTKAWSNPVNVTRSTSGCIVYDSLRDRIVQFPVGLGTDWAARGHYFSAVDGSGLTPFEWSGTPPTNLINRWRGVAWYEPNIDRYVYMPQATTEIWHIHPVTFACVKQTTSGTAPALSLDLPVGNRFQYIPAYRGCIFFSQVGENAAFIRTS